MTIAVNFDALAGRLRHAADTIPGADPAVPTDAATLASAELAGAAATFMRVMSGRRRRVREDWESLAEGCVGAAGDFRTYESSVVDSLHGIGGAL